MTSRTAGRVAWIHVAPVKGMALVALDTADLTATGIEVDRRFCVLDPAGRIQNGKVAGPLVRIAPDYDAGAGMLGVEDAELCSGVRHELAEAWREELERHVAE